MADKRTSGAESGRDKRLTIAVIIGAATVVALLGVIVVLLLNRPAPTVIVRETSPDNNEGRTTLRGVVTRENAEEIAEDFMSKPVSVPQYYEVSMNNVWHFPDGASPSTDAFVENSTANSTDVYFDVLMADDETNVIYASPVIPVGEHVEKFQLERSLDAGTYSCVCVYHLVDANQRTLSTLRMAVTVIVEQ